MKHTVSVLKTGAGMELFYRKGRSEQDPNKELPNLCLVLVST